MTQYRSRLLLRVCAPPMAGAIALSCGALPRERISDAQQGIVGGNAPPPGAWPAVGWLAEPGCSATLVAPSLVLYAAHCGIDLTSIWFGDRFLPEGPSAEGEVPIAYCEKHPSAGIGSGADIAFCELADALVGVPVLPIATACVRAQLTEGIETTLIGFGFDSPTGTGEGTKRVARAPLEHIDLELTIGNSETGTCDGDSGGPALVRIEEEWWLVGVLSSGRVGSCGAGFYTDASRHVGWLESASQRDLSPCFDNEGRWESTEQCRSAPIGRNGETLSDAGGRSRACGDGSTAETNTRSSRLDHQPSTRPTCSYSTLGATRRSSRMLALLMAVLVTCLKHRRQRQRDSTA